MHSTGIEPAALRPLTLRSSQLSYAAASSSANIDLTRNLLKINKNTLRKLPFYRYKYFNLGMERGHDVTPKSCNAEKVKILLKVF